VGDHAVCFVACDGFYLFTGTASLGKVACGGLAQPVENKPLKPRLVAQLYMCCFLLGVRFFCFNALKLDLF